MNHENLDRCQELRVENAFKEGDFEALKSLVGDTPGFPDCKIPRELGGSHCLEYAIYHSPLPFIRALIELGAEPNYEDPGGFPSLMAALATRRDDKHEIIRLLLLAGADPNQRGTNDWTPLHYAASQNDVQAIELLVANGARLTARTQIDNYNSPLEEAERGGHREAVKTLKTALDQARAMRSPEPSPETSRRREEISHEIDAAFAWRNYPGDEEIAIRHDAVWRFFCGKKWAEVTMKEVEEEREVDWNAFLFTLTLQGLVYYLPAFLKLAQQVDWRVDIGEPLLFHLGRYTEPVADALTAAERRALVHVMEWLSAEYERRGDTENLAQRALDDFWADMSIEELKQSRNPKRIHAAFKEGDLATLLAVFEPDFPNCEMPVMGTSCLEHAIRNGPLSLIRAMMDLGAEFRDRGTYGRTSLCEALSNPHPEKLEILEYLISLGADVNQRDLCGRTPLHWAAVFNNSAVIDFLVAHGADLRARTQDDDAATPLELAEKDVFPSPEAEAALRKALQREEQKDKRFR